jgi:hypothetical protein
MNLKTIAKGIGIGFVAGLILLAQLMPRTNMMEEPYFKDAVNLRHLRDALTFYSEYHDGKFPDVGKNAAENFDCLREHLESEKILETLKADYFYIPGLTNKDFPDTVIAGEKTVRNSYGISYITIDGKIWPAKLPKLLGGYEREQRKAIYIGSVAGILAALFYLIFKKIGKLRGA